jgi:hypothetical protein
VRRREFITLIGGAAVAWPRAARAQQPRKLPTIGFLGSATPAIQCQWVAAFVQRLRELGWIEGRTIAIEYRCSNAVLAAQAFQHNADLLFSGMMPACGSANIPDRLFSAVRYACSLVSSLLLNGATMSQESSLTQSAHSVRQALTAYIVDDVRQSLLRGPIAVMFVHADTQLNKRRIRVSTTERMIDVTIGK